MMTNATILTRGAKGLVLLELWRGRRRVQARVRASTEISSVTMAKPERRE